MCLTGVIHDQGIDTLRVGFLLPITHTLDSSWVFSVRVGMGYIAGWRKYDEEGWVCPTDLPTLLLRDYVACLVTHTKSTQCGLSGLLLDFLTPQCYHQWKGTPMTYCPCSSSTTRLKLPKVFQANNSAAVITKWYQTNCKGYWREQLAGERWLTYNTEQGDGNIRGEVYACVLIVAFKTISV